MDLKGIIYKLFIIKGAVTCSIQNLNERRNLRLEYISKNNVEQLQYPKIHPLFTFILIIVNNLLIPGNPAQVAARQISIIVTVVFEVEQCQSDT